MAIELELRGAMDMIERARSHTYGSNPCIAGIDHFETVNLLYAKYLEVKAELTTSSYEPPGDAMPKGHYQRTPKQFQRPTITSRLMFLEVGERAIFTLKTTLDAMLSEVSTTWGQRTELQGMRFKNETYMLVRCGEVAVPIVVTTRTA